MIVEQAKAILMGFLSTMCDEKYPIAWVGDVAEDRPATFILEGNIHAENEDPRDDYNHFFVNKDDGSCGFLIE